MSTATVAKPKQGLNLTARICLVLTVLFVALGLMMYLSDSDSSKSMSTMSGQITKLNSETETLETLQARLEKRETQLAQAKDALAAAPEDEKLISKLDRAQSEYNKALKNRDKQLAAMEGIGNLDTLNQEIGQLKLASSGKRLVGNIGIALALISLMGMLAFASGNAGMKLRMTLAGFLLGAALIVLGIHQNNLVPSLAAGETMPGTIFITAGVGILTVSLLLYCAFLTKARLDLKLMVGGAILLTAGGLIITGILRNNAPNAQADYVNAMSPGFLYLFFGTIAAIIGVMITVLPFIKIRYDLRKNPVLLLMILPSVIYFLITSYLPMVGVYFAFTNYQFTTSFFTTLFGSEFVGLKNFEYLFSSGIAWKMTFNTVFYNLIFILLGTVIKVAIAIMFSEIMGKKYKKFVQTVTFLPHFISMVMIGTFAYSLLNYNTGIINSVIVKLGGARIDFYSIPWAWYIIIPIVEFWKSVGYGSIIYVSAITGISDELFEAADLDGASFMQEIRHITIPSIRPTIVILVLMSLGNIMRGSFDLFYQLIGRAGKLFEATEIIDTYVWRSLRDNVQIGMGSAAGLYQSIVGMILVVAVNAIVKKIEPDYSIF